MYPKRYTIHYKTHYEKVVEMAENIHLAVHFEGSPLKKLVSTYVSDEFGEPLKDWAIGGHPNINVITGYELSGTLEETTDQLTLMRKHSEEVPWDLLNGRLVRGVTELLSIPGYRVWNPDNDSEFRHVDTSKGFTPVQSVGGDVGRLIVVAPLV